MGCPDIPFILIFRKGHRKKFFSFAQHEDFLIVVRIYSRFALWKVKFKTKKCNHAQKQNLLCQSQNFFLAAQNTKCCWVGNGKLVWVRKPCFCNEDVLLFLQKNIFPCGQRNIFLQILSLWNVLYYCVYPQNHPFSRQILRRATASKTTVTS